MAEQSRRADANAAIARSYKVRGAIAGVVTVLCLGYLTWTFWPKPDVVIKPEETPSAEWMRAYGELASEHSKAKDAFYWATAGITVEPSADKSGVTVKGKVKTAAELALLKAEMAKVQPSAPIEWQVTVGQ